MMTLTQAAAALGITPDAARRAAQQGRLKVIRMSPRSVLVEAAEVERYRNAPKHAGGRPRKGKVQECQ